MLTEAEEEKEEEEALSASEDAIGFDLRIGGGGGLHVRLPAANLQLGL